MTATVGQGGGWLLGIEDFGTVFTPEDLSDEHRLIARTAGEFLSGEVMPALEQLERQDWNLARQLLNRAGSLGLLGTDVPERFGGIDLDKAASIVVAQGIGGSASFAAAFGAQTGLAIMPLLAFGTEEQQQKYLPRLVSGDIVGAYALSESGSGSDALGAKARAVRDPDGSFRITGEKLWITNGGFADVFIVFAKVDGEQFSAFIVERGFDGVSHGREEHKMGLHGSSTCPLILQDARVPAANLLGEIGQGHKVAFNVLNYGRFKLGAIATGAAVAVLAESARYAATRRQFGRPIASFGAIRHKIGEMTVRTWMLESLLYRTTGLIDAMIVSSDEAESAKLLGALEEFAVESSIAKVAGSEVLHYVIDENVQIHGGNGFVRDYPAERHYRDSRVNRIFEGTNEINRLLITGMIVRRAVKGTLPLIPAARALQDEIMGPPSLVETDETLLGEERRLVSGFKKAALMVIGTAMQTYGEELSDEQEVLGASADLLIDVYAAESGLRRALQCHAAGYAGAPLHLDAARLFIGDAAGRVELTARSALAAMTDGDTLRTLQAALRRLVKATPVNSVALRRTLADKVVKEGGYIF